jgi:hypothetical protein
MSRFQVLPPYEAKQFDEPPKFNRTEREEYFIVDRMLDHVMTRGVNDESKVGAIIQLGYFRANGKFYATESFLKNGFVD